MSSKTDITNVNYLQDKADGYKVYIICTKDSGFWHRGQIIARLKTEERAAELLRKSLLSDVLVSKPVGYPIRESDL